MSAAAVVHPQHRIVTRVAPGLDQVARPHPGFGLTAWRQRRACRQAGGHWWHPLNGMGVDWFCCSCGKLTDGSPKDGARR